MEQNNDSFKEKLEQTLLTLQNCQKEHNLESCLNCEFTLNCETRENYVRAVYESMNKGESGGFEF
jgi:hypothetical protein